MPKRKTREEFIEKAHKVHGDKYDYSKVEYIHSKTKVIIICPEHGEFLQTPGSHCNQKAGCNTCSGNVQLDTESFIKKAREIHGDKYDYSKVEYIRSRTKVIIICPEHGEFLQTPSSHCNGHACPTCSGNAQLDTESFIKKAREIHGDKYDYSKVEYATNRTKVAIICSEHGEFLQRPYDHSAGRGCDHCGGTATLDVKSFTKKAREIHGDKYDYSKVEYINGRIKVAIICPEHGEFLQVPSEHLFGYGCSTCNESKGEKAIRLYLESHQITHDKQYKFKTSIIKRQPFDFATKTGVIEYQGEPHYRPTSFGSKGKYAKFQNFETYIQRDNNKLQWCQKHNIPLLYIPYWDNDRIPEILDDFFAGKTPTFSETPKIVNQHKSVRKKIREHLKIEGDEVLCGLINS